MVKLPDDLEPWTEDEAGYGLLNANGEIVHWRLDDAHRPRAGEVADRLGITEAAIRFTISPEGGISAVSPVRELAAGESMQDATQQIVSSDDRWHVDESLDDPSLWEDAD
jgi:hypothetical protein